MKVENTEVAKWIAFVAMLADHVGKLWELGHWTESLGRVAYPVFLFCLCVAYSGAGWNRLIKAAGRLALLGGIAQVISPMGVHSITLNVLFTFAVGLLVWACLVERLYFPAGVFFVVAGACVEYWWVGLALQIALLVWMSRCSLLSFVPVALMGLALCYLNADWMTIGAVPVVLLASKLPCLVRSPVSFGKLYPAHLAALAVAHSVIM